MTNENETDPTPMDAAPQPQVVETIVESPQDRVQADEAAMRAESEAAWRADVEGREDPAERKAYDGRL